MEFERILIRAPNWLGDAILSIPAVEQIRLRFPQAYVTALAPSLVAELYGPPHVDEVIPYGAPSGFRGLHVRWKLVAELRAKRFDAAILMQNGRDAAVTAWLAGIPARIGYDRASRGRWLTHSVQESRRGENRRHHCYYYLELLRRAGLIESLPDVSELRLAIASRHGTAGKGLAGAWIGVAPGSANGSAKRWLPERFALSAATAAAGLGARAAVFGVSAERDLCGRVADIIRVHGVEAINFAGKTTTGEFIGMVAGCAAMLTNDSGAMHVASALGVPTVAVFGPTDPCATGPIGAAARVIHEPVDCSPCLLHECPIDHRCMTGVSAARVANELLAALKLPGNESQRPI
jgi:heptosyltransferase-2